ncbi:POK7 protein, partial [Campylorhamphus procurvoides]|nr:POK7 protein [Campylorhamphus procurvoides]
FKHTTGTPDVSTGQTIVERAKRTLKEYLEKQTNPDTVDPVTRLNKVLFTLNFFSLAADAEQPPGVIHNNRVKMQATPEIKIRYKNPQTGPMGRP